MTTNQTLVVPVAQLKQFALLHTDVQGIPAATSRRIMEAVVTSDGDGPGSWVRTWSAEAEQRQARGDHLGASACYNMARFPYVDGPARRQALDDCVQSFDRWRSGQDGIVRIDTDGPQGGFRCWAAGLSTQRPRPLLLVMGGIVSIKEQWAPLLARARRLGVALLVTEMPGVGENSLRYDLESWRMVSQAIDLVADQADVSRTCAVALSFSGHLALRCSLHDDRIKGVVTVGAPVQDFFARAVGAGEVPQITTDTLVHHTGRPRGELAEAVADWGLSTDELSDVRARLAYVASRRDEIIPRSEVDLMRRHVRDLRLLEYDDVHGSPAHTAETRAWVMSQALDLIGVKGLVPRVLAARSQALRMRRALLTSKGAAR